MKADRERTFAAFAGPGIDFPSKTMRVTEDEAKAILHSLDGLEWLTEHSANTVKRSGFRICNATASWTTALFHGDAIIGFYAASYLWIAKPWRGMGLSIPLILAAADHRGGRVLPPGVVSQGYTLAGLAAHFAAYQQSMLLAPADDRQHACRSKNSLRRGDRITQKVPTESKKANQRLA